MVDASVIGDRFAAVGHGLNERSRRLLAAAEGRSAGYGGIAEGSPPLNRRDPALLEHLRQLVEPATMGDPMRPLLWVSKSHEKLAAALREMGHKIADSSIPQLLGLLK